MKLTKRKGFSFLRSYFDVLNKLQTDEDQLAFLMAVINKQFLNEDPEKLKFPVDLAYDSQVNAIDCSVKGWLRASKTDMQGKPIDTPTTHPRGKTNSIPKEEKEKEKEKEKEVEKGKRKKFTPPTLTEFMIYAKGTFPNDDEYKKYRQRLINKHKAWEANGWRNDYQNKPIKIWKTTLLNTINAWMK